MRLEMCKPRRDQLYKMKDNKLRTDFTIALASNPFALKKHEGRTPDTLHGLSVKCFLYNITFVIGMVFGNIIQRDKKCLGRLETTFLLLGCLHLGGQDGLGISEPQ